MNLIPDVTPMDPNQFAVNWATLFEMLALIIVLAFLVERVLALVYESKPYLRFSLNREREDKGDFKTMGASALSALATILFNIDIIAGILSDCSFTLPAFRVR